MSAASAWPSDAGDLVRVSTTPPGGVDNGYGYSPDGSRILYAQFANEHGTLFSVKPDGSDPVQRQAWVVHPDGTALRKVTPPVNGAIFQTPVWSPDSTKLLINRQDLHNGQTSLWTVNTDGSGLLKLADTESLSLYAWGSAAAD